MVNHVNNFVNSITSLSSEESAKDLAEFCKKWLEESAEKLSLADIDRILTALPPVKFTAGHICALAAKLPKLRAADESGFIEFAARIDDNLLAMNDVQILWIQDLYSRFFHHLSDEFIKRNLAIYGLRIAANAILKLTGGSSTLLTNIHSALFCLCLQARRFDVALPFFQINVTELFLSAPTLLQSVEGILQEATGPNASNDHNRDEAGPSDIASNEPCLPTDRNVRKIHLDTRHVLTYFYYGALILGTMERWDEALRMLEHCICLPGLRLSAIVVEALKKYILVSLLLGRNKPMHEIPNYKSTVIQRQCVPVCVAYTRLADLVDKHTEQRRDVAGVIASYLEQKSEVFLKDDNYGLVKQLIVATKENAIKRLGTVFISLHLNEVSRLAHVSNAETEEILRRLCHKCDYNVKIDQKTNTFRFDLESSSESGAPTDTFDKEEVEAAIREVISLHGLINEFDAAVRLHPLYIIKNTKSNFTTGPGTTYNMYMQEDEGFQITGSPPIS